MGQRDWARLVARRRRLRFYEHMPAARVLPLVGREVWESYFKFTIERNPWDKVISAYYWRHRAVPEPWEPISEWLQRRDAHVRGFEIYSLGGRVAVDRVLRYETLDDDLASVVSDLGLPGPVVLPHAKGSVRGSRQSHREMLDEADRRMIAVEYAVEVALMGYEF